MLRSRAGAAIQAIRDNEDAAASVGVRVVATKRLLFVLAAFGIGMAGALWLATAMTFQPKTYFSVQWTAYMIFMVLVGGIGRFEGAILGAIIFFLIETWFGGAGVWYLIGLGATALVFSLLLPRGLWGAIEARFGICGCCRSATGWCCRQGRLHAARSKTSDRPTGTSRKRMTMLLGKTILITGVASGIGARTAELAGQLGADVIGVDMREPATLYGTFVKADISTKAGVDELVATSAAAASMRSAMSPACPARPAPRRRSPSISTACARCPKRWRRRSARAAPSSMSPRSPASAGAPISTAPRRWSASRAFPMSPRSSPTTT